MTKVQLPLEGLRVLGVGDMLAGPYLEQVLGDFGADVIHVEKPDRGDEARHTPPYHGGRSLVHVMSSRNKRSVTLNLKSERGRVLFRALAQQSDIVVESVRPGQLERWGLGYQDLARSNPRIIHVSVSGFGLGSSDYRRLSYNQIAQAESGFMAITGTASSGPLRTPAIVADLLASLLGVVGVLLALRSRDKSGEGQQVDVSLMDGMLAALGPALQEYLASGRTRKPTGNWAPTMAPSNVYDAVDGPVMVVAGSDFQWQRLTKAMNREDVGADRRFATSAGRVTMVKEVDGLISNWVRERSVKDIIRILVKAGVPVAELRSLGSAAQNAGEVGRNLIAQMGASEGGGLRVLGPLPRLGKTPGVVRSEPPRIGQHTEEVLSSLLGISPEEIVGLGQEGIV